MALIIGGRRAGGDAEGGQPLQGDGAGANNDLESLFTIDKAY